MRFKILAAERRPYERNSTMPRFLAFYASGSDYEGNVIVKTDDVKKVWELEDDVVIKTTEGTYTTKTSFYEILTRLNKG